MALQNLDTVNDLSKITPEDIDSIGDHYGNTLADRNNGIKTWQVRNIFSSVLALRTKQKSTKDGWNEEIHNELVLIKPKLAYASGRQKNVKPLYELLSKAISATVDSNDKKKGLTNFIQLVESIVAYHKFYGGN